MGKGGSNRFKGDHFGGITISMPASALRTFLQAQPF